jgi:hypothetical protein
METLNSKRDTTPTFNLYTLRPNEDEQRLLSVTVKSLEVKLNELDVQAKVIPSFDNNKKRVIWVFVSPEKLRSTEKALPKYSIPIKVLPDDDLQIQEKTFIQAKRSWMWF